jgi:NitT/TauT family transport system substrate-binding protein
VLVTTRQQLATDREQVARMVAAVRAGWEDYLRDPSATNAAMAELNRAMDAQTFVDSAMAQAPLIRPEGLERLGVMNLERWQTLVTQLRDLRLVRREIDPATLYEDF